MDSDKKTKLLKKLNDESRKYYHECPLCYTVNLMVKKVGQLRVVHFRKLEGLDGQAKTTLEFEQQLDQPLASYLNNLQEQMDAMRGAKK